MHANTGLRCCFAQVVYLTEKFSAVLGHKAMSVMGKHAWVGERNESISLCLNPCLKALVALVSAPGTYNLKKIYKCAICKSVN